MAEGKRLYRPAEAAETLGLSRARIYQLIASGEISSVKLGSSRRIASVDLDDFVNRLRLEHGADATAERQTPALATI